MDDKLLTLSELAEESGRTATSIRRTIRAGHLRATLYGRTYLVRREDWEEYLKNPPRRGPKSTKNTT